MRRMLSLSVLLLIFAEIFSLQAEDVTIKPPQEPRTKHPVRANVSSDHRPWETDQVEYRLTKLEVLLADKSDVLRAELKETTRRLEALEWQSAEVQTALNSFGNQLESFTQAQQPIDKLELRVDDLAKGVRLVVAALRGINSDIGTIKRNVSAVERHTRALLENNDDLIGKPLLADTLPEVRDYRAEQSAPSHPSSERDLPTNCKDVQARGNNISGIYRIRPELAPRAFMVLCDMDTRGGGWTYFHNRYGGAQDFYLNWQSYKLGFGNLGGGFWLGLEYLHQLTGYEVQELLVELVDVDLKKVEAHYEAFSVGNEEEGYALKVLAGYSGNAGDSLIYHAGGKFSTKDVDQDDWPEGSCAQSHAGAWWYRSCDMSNLNGKYLSGSLSEDQLYQGMYWGGFHGAQYSLLGARMLVRPRHKDNSSLLQNLFNKNY